MKNTMQKTMPNTTQNTMQNSNTQTAAVKQRIDLHHHWLALGAALLALSFFSPAWGQSLGCYESARATTTLDNSTALQLCCNKNSPAPVSCFNRARAETTMGVDDALILCTCADNTRPVDCFNAAANQTTLDTSDTLGMCARNPERGFVPNSPSVSMQGNVQSVRPAAPQAH